MTSNQGGGTHPGDPWSPDWVPAGSDAPEDEWPFDDDSLTLSTAEMEIAGLEDDDEEAVDEVAEAAEVESEIAEDETPAEVEADAAATEAEEEAAPASDEESEADLDIVDEDEADLAAAASIEAALAEATSESDDATGVVDDEVSTEAEDAPAAEAADAPALDVDDEVSVEGAETAAEATVVGSDDALDELVAQVEASVVEEAAAVQDATEEVEPEAEVAADADLPEVEALVDEPDLIETVDAAEPLDAALEEGSGPEAIDEPEVEPALVDDTEAAELDPIAGQEPDVEAVTAEPEPEVDAGEQEREAAAAEPADVEAEEAAGEAEADEGQAEPEVAAAVEPPEAKEAEPEVAAAVEPPEADAQEADVDEVQAEPEAAAVEPPEAEEAEPEVAAAVEPPEADAVEAEPDSEGADEQATDAGPIEGEPGVAEPEAEETEPEPAAAEVEVAVPEAEAAEPESVESRPELDEGGPGIDDGEPEAAPLETTMTEEQPADLDVEEAEPELAEADLEEIEAEAAGDADEAHVESPGLHAVADIEVPASDQASVDVAIEEVALEDLQAEPEWLEAVEEMTLDDIAEVGEGVPVEAIDDAAAPAEVDAADAPASVDEPEVVIEDATFEVVDLDDAELRADTAEHLFDALDFEGEDVAHDAVTAEVLAVAEPEPAPDEITEAADEVFEFIVPAEYEQVAADVDAMSGSLAAYMGAAPPADEAADALDEALEDVPAGIVVGSDLPTDDAKADEPPDDAGGADPADLVPEEIEAEPPASADADSTEQLQIPTEPTPAAETMPSEADDEPAGEPQPLTAEEELIASLTGDLQLPDFETFVEDDFARDFVPEPTQEHRGLADALSEAPPAEPAELSALAATMPGVDHGHVGFSEFDDDLHFEDPDAPAVDADGDEDAEPAAVVAPGGSDLTLRVASALVLVALLAGTLWAGGVTFLIFISIIAMAAQIEFYTALRQGGYRPMVLFGLLGGLGALIGTYAQGSDVLTDGPIAIPAALALTVVATFAWYGSQETPPRDPWRNGLTTVLGVAWIPAALALVFPMAEVGRSERLQIIIVLLIAIAAFDVGSYFVGKALGSRKLSPVLSPNKTVEGLIGGVVATVLIAVIAGAAVDVFSFGNALAISAAIIVAAPLGDLAESLIKRSLGIKDMGQLIPGHGGVLDRIDSYLFAVPIAYLMLRWTGLL